MARSTAVVAAWALAALTAARSAATCASLDFSCASAWRTAFSAASRRPRAELDCLDGGVDLLRGDGGGLGPLHLAVTGEVGQRLVKVGLRLDHLGPGGGNLLPLHADLGKALADGRLRLLRARDLALVTRLVGGGVEDRQHLARTDDLVVLDQHLPDQPRHLRRDADDMAVDIGVVGRLILPRVQPVEDAADDRADDDDGDDDQQDWAVAEFFRRRLVPSRLVVRLVFARLVGAVLLPVVFRLRLGRVAAVLRLVALALVGRDAPLRLLRACRRIFRRLDVGGAQVVRGLIVSSAHATSINAYIFSRNPRVWARRRMERTKQS